jgi:chemotaxis protein CheX
MNVNYINPFIDASIDVFKTFANIKSEPGQPLVRNKPGTNGDIIGFIGLNGHGINGYFGIHFSSLFLNKILVTLFDGHTTATREELYDLAGELTNMITGNAKATLSKKGFFFDVAVPKISHTTPKISAELKNNPVIIVPFATRMGEFNIEASIRTIAEDLAKDTMAEVPPPHGMLSVEQFARETRIDPIKIRRFLKTGYIPGKKISNRQWHIPESELEKIIGSQKFQAKKKKKKRLSTETTEATIGVEAFSKLSGLSSAKIKGFLRSGFLKGYLDKTNTWQVEQDEISKFKKK